MVMCFNGTSNTMYVDQEHNGVVEEDLPGHLVVSVTVETTIAVVF